MKKFVLLSLCFSIIGMSACSSIFNDNDDNDYVSPELAPVIDSTTNPNSRCGVDGISCNDTALVNYTKTAADYIAYGERTARDSLYTQSGAGNNLTATIRPGIEEDVVTRTVTRSNIASDYSVVDDGPFSNTDTLSIEQDGYKTASNTAPNADPEVINTKDGKVIVRKNYEEPANEVGRSDNITYKEVGESGSEYEIICEEECDDFIDSEDDTITSEFTEDSFDIANYVDDEPVEFTEIGATTVTAELNTEELKITDETILTWDAEEGTSLRELLTKWSAMAGWKLLWNTNRNYVLSAGVMFKGKFADVSSALIRAFARARPAPIATYYKGNRVIVIETMENENAY